MENIVPLIVTAHKVNPVVISLEIQDLVLVLKNHVNIITNVELVNLVVISPGVKVLVLDLV